MHPEADLLCSVRVLPFLTLAVRKPFGEGIADENALAYLATRPI
jgi:hypothetical protein